MRPSGGPSQSVRGKRGGTGSRRTQKTVRPGLGDGSRAGRLVDNGQGEAEAPPEMEGERRRGAARTKEGERAAKRVRARPKALQQGVRTREQTRSDRMQPCGASLCVYEKSTRLWWAWELDYPRVTRGRRPAGKRRSPRARRGGVESHGQHAPKTHRRGGGGALSAARRRGAQGRCGRPRKHTGGAAATRAQYRAGAAP
jgi:hypothetical protein